MSRTEPSPERGQSAVDPDRIDRRGQVLVVAVVVTLVALPTALLVAPPTWLTYRFAFLALPVLPAAALGVLAVWAALSNVSL